MGWEKYIWLVSQSLLHHLWIRGIFMKCRWCSLSSVIFSGAGCYCMQKVFHSFPFLLCSQHGFWCHKKTWVWCSVLLYRLTSDTHVSLFCFWFCLWDFFSPLHSLPHPLFFFFSLDVSMYHYSAANRSSRLLPLVKHNVDISPLRITE